MKTVKTYEISGGSKAGAPQGPKFSQFHAVFLENFGKMVGWRPLLMGWRPLLRGIRHWK